MSTEIIQLYYKPLGGLLDRDAEIFLGNYTKKIYPKRLEAFGVELRDWYRTVLKNSAKGAYIYSLVHYTDTEECKYSFEEWLVDSANETGLCVSIEPSTEDEKARIAQAQAGDSNTGSVKNVIALLEDSLEHESWAEAICHNGERASKVALELIALLKRIRLLARVMRFICKSIDNKLGLTLELVIPSVVNYHVKIIWTIK